MKVRLKTTTKGLEQDCNRLNEALVGRYLTYPAMQGASPNTVMTYENGLRNFLRFLGGQSILAVKHADLLSYLSGLDRRGLSKSSVANQLYARSKQWRQMTRWSGPLPAPRPSSTIGC